MAPFRSSRSTRNNDPATLNRGRGGVIDHDPTEGLPVRNWYLGNVSVKQDEQIVQEDDQQVDANTINPDYPWPELPLPSFFSELPPLSQQIIRIARTGRPVKPSVYDKKTGSYISHAEYSARNALKSKHLENVDSPTADDDDEMDDDTEAKPDNAEDKERAFSMRKWAQIPPAVADRRPDPKYLADRRPGMRSLYGFQAAALNPALNLAATGPTTAAFDLGDGSGLGNATGMLAAGTEQLPMAVMPVKRMPPKRKKKGGPGRKKANHGPGRLGTNGGTNGVVGMDGASPGGVRVESDASHGLDNGVVNTEGDTNMEDVHDGEGEGEGEGSGSEEEGSEEGEIEESHPADEGGRAPDIEMKVEPVTQPGEQPGAPTEEQQPMEAEVEEATVPAEKEQVPTPPEPEPMVQPKAVMGPELVSAQALEPDPAPVDFLGSLDIAVADMEKKED